CSSTRAAPCSRWFSASSPSRPRSSIADMAELDSFRTARWLRTFHLVLQGLLLSTFLAGLNYVVRDHPLRFDLTQHHSYSLLAQTLSYRHDLERPVRIVATFTDTTENPELRGLLREYATAT